jgi:hypothetical protein
VEVGIDEADTVLTSTAERGVRAPLLMLRAILSPDPAGDRARRAMDQAMELFELDPGGTMMQLIAPLAGAFHAQLRGAHEEALGRATEILARATASGDRYSTAVAGSVFAFSALALGTIDAALRQAIVSARAYRELENESGAAYAAQLAAAAELKAGRIESARRLYAISRRGYRRTGTRHWRSEQELHSAIESSLRETYGGRLDQLLSEDETAQLEVELTRLEATLASAGDSASAASPG